MPSDPRGEEPLYGWPSHPGSPVDLANQGKVPRQPMYNPVASGTVYTEALAKGILYYWLFRILGAVFVTVAILVILGVASVDINAAVMLWVALCVLMFVFVIWMVCRFVASIFRLGRRY